MEAHPAGKGSGGFGRGGGRKAGSYGTSVSSPLSQRCSRYSGSGSKWASGFEARAGSGSPAAGGSRASGGSQRPPCWRICSMISDCCCSMKLDPPRPSSHPAPLRHAPRRTALAGPRDRVCRTRLSAVLAARAVSIPWRHQLNGNTSLLLCRCHQA